MRVRFDQLGFARPPHDSVVERTVEKFRENCDEIKSHGRKSAECRRNRAYSLRQVSLRSAVLRGTLSLPANYLWFIEKNGLAL